MGHIHGALPEPLDEPVALIGSRVVEEVARLGSHRDLAGDIEADAVEELRVIGRRGRLDLRLHPLGREVAIDRCGQRSGLLRRAGDLREDPETGGHVGRQTRWRRGQ